MNKREIFVRIFEVSTAETQHRRNYPPYPNVKLIDNTHTKLTEALQTVMHVFVSDTFFDASVAMSYLCSMQDGRTAGWQHKVLSQLVASNLGLTNLTKQDMGSNERSD